MVLLQELVHDVRSVAHDIILALRVSYCVCLHTKHFIRGSWVTPKNVHAHLLDRVVDITKVDAQGPLNHVDVLQLDDGVANASMDAQDSVLSRLILDDCSKWHPLEQVIQLLEDTVWFIDVLVESLSALLSQTEVAIHVSVFVVASQKENLARILQFERQKQANDFQRLTATVYIVTQEQVVETANVAVLLGRSPNVEEAHQVVVVAVQVAKNLDGWFQVLNQHWLSKEHLHYLVDQLKNLLLFDVERSHWWDCTLAFAWLQQVLDKERVE